MNTDNMLPVDCTLLLLLVVQFYPGCANITTTMDASVRAFVGTSIQLNCRTDAGAPIRWNHYEEQSGVELRIHNGYALNPNLTLRHAVTYSNATGSSVLTIRDVTRDDRGTYVCLEYYKAKHKLEFKLAVRDPSLDTTSSTTIYATFLPSLPTHLLTTRTLIEAPKAESPDPTTKPSSGGTTSEVTHIALGLIGLLAIALIIIAVFVVVAIVRCHSSAIQPDNKQDFAISRSLRQNHRLAFDEFNAEAVGSRRWPLSEIAYRPNDIGLQQPAGTHSSSSVDEKYNRLDRDLSQPTALYSTPTYTAGSPQPSVAGSPLAVPWILSSPQTTVDQSGTDASQSALGRPSGYEALTTRTPGSAGQSSAGPPPTSVVVADEGDVYDEIGDGGRNELRYAN